MKLFREPLVHFLFIGVAIYLLYGLFAEPISEQPDNTIVVSAAEIKGMEISWQKRWNRPPTVEEFDGLIQQYIREIVLYREALMMGLDKHDPIIRRRLGQKLEFLAKDLVALTPPEDGELQAYFNAHQQRYAEPARFTFTQVYINSDKRGDATLADAEKIKATLMAQGDLTAKAAALGDGFILQNYYLEKSQAEIQKLFGHGFSESLIELSPGQWHGPIQSGYGVHLVYVSSIIESPTPIFSEVQQRVAQDWSSEKGKELNEKFYASLRARYTIVIDDTIEDDSLTAIQKQTP